MREDLYPELSGAIIRAAIEVHRALGPGLLESVYEDCLAHELGLQRLAYQRQVVVPLEYKGLRLQAAYRVDLVVEGKVVLELKAVEKVLDVHLAQMMTYLRLTGLRLGLLLNFCVPKMTDGVWRRVL